MRRLQEKASLRRVRTGLFYIGTWRYIIGFGHRVLNCWTNDEQMDHARVVCFKLTSAHYVRRYWEVRVRRCKKRCQWRQDIGCSSTCLWVLAYRSLLSGDLLGMLQYDSDRSFSSDITLIQNSREDNSALLMVLIRHSWSILPGCLSEYDGEIVGNAIIAARAASHKEMIRIQNISSVSHLECTARTAI